MILVTQVNLSIIQSGDGGYRRRLNKMPYMLKEYSIHNSKRKEDPRNYIPLAGNNARFTGCHIIYKELLNEFLDKVFPEGYLRGTMVLSSGPGETVRMTIYYGAHRLRGAPSYGTVDAYCEEYPYDSNSDEDENLPPRYEDVCAIFSREIVMAYENEADYIPGNVHLGTQHLKDGCFRYVREVYLDPADDFTLDEVRSMGTSEWYISKHIKVRED